jgi:hypothetical protein
MEHQKAISFYTTVKGEFPRFPASCQTEMQALLRCATEAGPDRVHICEGELRGVQRCMERARPVRQGAWASSERLRERMSAPPACWSVVEAWGGCCEGTRKGCGVGVRGSRCCEACVQFDYKEAMKQRRMFKSSVRRKLTSMLAEHPLTSRPIWRIK